MKNSLHVSESRKRNRGESDVDDIFVLDRVRNGTEAPRPPTPPSILTLNEQNKHPKDDLIVFTEKNHEYHIDGKKVRISVTGLKEHFTPIFDRKEVVKNMTKGRMVNGKYRPKCGTKSEYYGLTVQQIYDKFDQKRDFGTDFHYCIERYYNDTPQRYFVMDTSERRHKLLYPDGVDGKCFKDFIIQIEAFLVFDERLRARGWKPYRVEWPIYYEELAGCIDAVFYKTNIITGKKDFMIVDWKTSSKDNLDDSRGKCQYPFQHMKGSKYNGFVLQMNLYATILHMAYGIHVIDMLLVIFYPTKCDELSVKRLNVDQMITIWRNYIKNEEVIQSWYSKGEWKEDRSLPRFPVPIFCDEPSVS